MASLRPLLFLTIASLLGLPFSSCAEKAAPSRPASAPAASASASEPTRGLVWRVDGGKAPMFLAGSFHLMKPGDYPLPPAYEQAWAESRQVIFEILPGETDKPGIRERMAGFGLLQEGKLSDKISVETWKSLQDWAAAAHVPAASLQRLQPWMAGLTIAVTTFEKQGYQASAGMEKHFAARLAESGKTALALESALGQLELFSRIGPERQEEVLRQALEEVRQPEKIDQLASAWRAGDAAALAARMHESFADFPELEKMLLNDRNAAWIPALEKLLQGDKATMVLVGAGHLCGPGSVADLLERKGYQIVPLTAPSTTQPASAPKPKPASDPAAQPRPAPLPKAA